MYQSSPDKRSPQRHPTVESPEAVYCRKLQVAPFTTDERVGNGDFCAARLVERINDSSLVVLEVGPEVILPSTVNSIGPLSNPSDRKVGCRYRTARDLILDNVGGAAP
jgi:hypothetical protein